MFKTILLDGAEVVGETIIDWEALQKKDAALAKRCAQIAPGRRQTFRGSGDYRVRVERMP